jgi:hypothetical protein
MFSEEDLANPEVSGPLATPFEDGISNLLRYAFGVPVGESAMGYLPTLIDTPPSYGMSFPFESGRDDLAVIVESSDELSDWSTATVLFDSKSDFPPTADGMGRISIVDSRPPRDLRFYRVRVVEK